MGEASGEERRTSRAKRGEQNKQHKTCYQIRDDVEEFQNTIQSHRHGEVGAQARASLIPIDQDLLAKRSEPPSLGLN